MTSAEIRQPDLSAGVQEALQRGDRRGALALVLEAERSAPQDIGLKLQRAMVSRALGDLAGALAALDEALSLDPYDYVALLSKGAVVERMGGERAAAAVYRNALSIAPPDDKL
ncbi:MAG: Aspartyl/Asparaginyl beta-hydroxylase, partial [Phenylobacterium sp.]|nr:Aspartyl/Asparaginyl beta-hydroxylase [Phenylobacterium sp.]